MKGFEKPYFVAGGHVAKPGKYELRSDLTLVEAITAALAEAPELYVLVAVIIAENAEGTFCGAV